MNQNFLFLSYSSSNIAFAEELALDLRRKGIPVWMDRLGGIDTGDIWQVELESAIDSEYCIGLISVLSPAYLVSKNCMRELRRADTLDKTIFPILLETVERFPWSVLDLHYADFRSISDGMEYIEKINDLADQLTSRLNLKLDSTLITDPSKLSIKLPSVAIEVAEPVSKSRTSVSYPTSGSTGGLEEKARQRLLVSVENHWIKGVLEKSKYANVDIEINMRDVGYLVGPFSKPERSPDEDFPLDIVAFFDQHGQSLLISGRQGAGKTIQLLTLAKHKLSTAKHNPDQPVPLILNLSSWDEGQSTLRDWLIDEMYIYYRIPRDLSGDWLDTDVPLLLFLDGLDEVRHDLRKDVVFAINEFYRDKLSLQLVVACRLEEYKAIGERLLLESAICLVLQPSAAKTYLSKFGRPFEALNHLLEIDVSLQKLVETAEMLSRVVEVMSKAPPEKVASLKASGWNASQLLAVYVQNALEIYPRNHGISFEKAETLRWLRWLAKELKENPQTVFRIELIQPKEVLSKEQLIVYWLLLRIPLLIAGGSIAIGAHLSTGATWLGFVVGILCGVLSAGLMVAISGEHVNSFLKLVSSPFQIGDNLDVGMQAGMVGAILGGAVTVAAAAFMGIFIQEFAGPAVFLTHLAGETVVGAIASAMLAAFIMTIISEEEAITPVETWEFDSQSAIRYVRKTFGMNILFSVASFLFALASRHFRVDLLFPVSIMFTYAAAMAIVGGLKIDALDDSGKHSEHAGMKQSATNAVRFGLGLGVVFAVCIGFVAFTLVEELMTSISIGIFAFLLAASGFGLIYGGYACLKHYALRFLLFYQNHIPLHFGRFLDYVVGQGLMQKAGNGYIFDGSLQDFFSSPDAEQMVSEFDTGK